MKGSGLVWCRRAKTDAETNTRKEKESKKGAEGDIRDDAERQKEAIKAG